ncbi:transketolase family protein [Amorphus coralli]|uniref:transketolase family protein n=1 Tax=Amorphus coralli TaxID=340680 RepID=UPI00036223AB|nr:transketolase C-terminal domain-containing protein [Amorphus coralli]
MRDAPYATELKPYGRALLALAETRPDILCITGDLTRQCEIDLFQDKLPGRFIHAGMAEANMMSMAGALARRGYIPFVHTFGVFATRRPYDQIVNTIAYPNLPVRIVGFMPGVSTPGGPSHQAIDDVAIMRAIPGMTIVDAADAQEIADIVPQIVDVPGPVYLRLKRGEVPVMFDEGHRFSLTRAEVIRDGGDVAILTSGMMLASAVQAADALTEAGISVSLVHVPVIKPLDRETLIRVIGRAKAVVAVENHTTIGGLGSAVAELIADEGLGVRLARVGLADTYAEGSLNAPHLFQKYSLSSQDVTDAAWRVAERAGIAAGGSVPKVRAVPVQAGEYAPV